ncbi:MULTISPECIES: sugar nucleotide-binding protein [Halobacterium]|uniref:sugar nucleotide-binding protein n=1 Tax=Halobacterium TaxID=2239 RepID=UPI001964DA3E|nr:MULTISPECIES: sugar nucleotide-binding protein [Halobacterium]MCF2164860.1 sugar nucleotide-binding protein [Halobacterium salinarum]MCF2168515.1 sugar nucleotide-binding protein [Halobacterium salinarum]MCF2207437.1 sugar nucleotide-binding protein [Halobacterium salinarum]MCF2238871.1 sugar nucleotide-binding protein [Halobacterium salinarum]MDL0123333.1 sugar nucleotide-binding protein [Halobacterium salinarum]
MDALVVGDTGPLDAALAARAGVTATPHPTEFDVFADDPAAHIAAHDPDTVIVTAPVHTADVPIPAYVDAVSALVDACADRRLVYASTGAVFDGTDGDYRPDDVRTPCDDTGRRIQVFEDHVDRHDTDNGVVLRVSSCYATDPLTPQLAAARDALDGGACQRHDDVYRSPVHVTDVADAITELAETDHTGVFHAPGPRLSVYELHERVLSALGVDTTDLTPAAVPSDTEIARDRSLAGPRFTELLDATVSPPQDAV